MIIVLFCAFFYKLSYLFHCFACGGDFNFTQFFLCFPSKYCRLSCFPSNWGTLWSCSPFWVWVIAVFSSLDPAYGFFGRDTLNMMMMMGLSFFPFCKWVYIFVFIALSCYEQNALSNIYNDDNYEDDDDWLYLFPASLFIQQVLYEIVPPWDGFI